MNTNNKIKYNSKEELLKIATADPETIRSNNKAKRSEDDEGEYQETVPLENKVYLNHMELISDFVYSNEIEPGPFPIPLILLYDHYDIYCGFKKKNPLNYWIFGHQIDNLGFRKKSIKVTKQIKQLLLGEITVVFINKDLREYNHNELNHLYSKKFKRFIHKSNSKK